MKRCRYVLPILLIILICLSSCNNNSKYSFEPLRKTVYGFFLTHKKLTANGTITIKGPEKYDISFTSPESLRYISYNIDSETVTVKFGEHQKTTYLYEFPEHSVIRLLPLAMKVFLFETHSFIKTDENTIQAQTEILKQTVTALFLEDGNIMRIDFPASDFSVIFDEN